MANMSYCRFQNTLEDLRDCYDNLDDDCSEKRQEARARIKLVELCQQIVDSADLEVYEEEYKASKGQS